MNSWILALLAIVVGIVLGMIVSRLVYRLVASAGREAVQSVAKPISQLAFSIFMVGGLIVALGFVQPDALDQLPKDAIAFFPKILTAAIIIIVARVLASFAATAISQATSRMPLNIERQIHMVVRSLIYTLAILLAVSTIGIDTEVVNMGLAAIFFGVAATLTLLIGLGGHGVAREVASNRAMRRLVSEGDIVMFNDVQGKVTAVHPTTIELEDPETQLTVLVPASRFVNEKLTVKRTPASEAAAATAEA